MVEDIYRETGGFRVREYFGQAEESGQKRPMAEPAQRIRKEQR